MIKTVIKKVKVNDQSSMDWNRFFDWGQVGRGIPEARYGEGVSRAG